MKAIEIYKSILKNNRNPCFIVEFSSNKVLCCNDEMKKLLMGRCDVIGSPFYEVIFDHESENAGVPTLEWGEQAVLRQRFFDNHLHKEFDVSYVVVEQANEKFLLIEYDIVLAKEEKPLHFELAKRLCFLEMADDAVIRALLHVLAEAYQADCAYLHLVNHEEKTIKLKSSWLNHSIKDTTHYLVQDVEDIAGFEGLILWASGRNQDGIWDCDETRKNSPQQMMDNLALGIFHRRNLILCGINNKNGELKAVISVGDCHSLSVNHKLLKYVASLIAEFLH